MVPMRNINPRMMKKSIVRARLRVLTTGSSRRGMMVTARKVNHSTIQKEYSLSVISLRL